MKKPISLPVPERLRNCQSRKYIQVQDYEYAGIYTEDEFQQFGNRHDSRVIGNSAIELIRVEDMLHPLIGSSGRLPRAAIRNIIRQKVGIAV